MNVIRVANEAIRSMEEFDDSMNRIEATMATRYDGPRDMSGFPLGDAEPSSSRGIRIVTGGQWGSEGKGSFINHIADRYRYHVRTGGPQAGHSVKLPGDNVLKFQVVPVGALQPGSISVIGMASVLDIGQLYKEMVWVKDATGRAPTVLVDYRCTVLEDHHVTAENIPDGNGKTYVDRMGSTAHGVGAARMARLERTAGTAADWAGQIRAAGALIEDTVPLVRAAAYGEGVLIEGAQGQGLSLFSGGFYPKCTSNECGPLQAFTDAGFSFREAGMVQSTGVFRTFPIRVAGHSGPMDVDIPLETTWEMLQDQYGDHIPVEQTTVTKKVRRVAHWDAGLARESVEFTALDEAALTFLDYPFPGDAGETQWNMLSPQARAYVLARETQLGVPIRTIGTGFGTYVER